MSSSAARWWCCRGTIRFAWRRRWRCSINCRAAASFLGWAGGARAWSSKAWASTTRPAAISSLNPASTFIRVCFGYCAEDAARAEEVANKHMGSYQPSVFEHNAMTRHNLPKIKGYESYKPAQPALSPPGGIEAAVKGFIKTQAWGTPEMCYEKLREHHEITGAQGLILVFTYGGIPYDRAESSMRLFASKVLPEVSKIVPLEQQTVTLAATAAE